MPARATANNSSASSRVTTRPANTSRLSHATSCAVTRRPRIIALMIVRLLSIAKPILRTCTTLDPLARGAGSDVGENLRVNIFRQVNPAVT